MPGLRECTLGMEIALGTPEWYSKVMYVKWKLVSVRFVILLVQARIGVQFAPNVPRAWKPFWAHPMVLLGVVSHVEARFGSFGGSVILSTR